MFAFIPGFKSEVFPLTHIKKSTAEAICLKGKQMKRPARSCKTIWKGESFQKDNYQYSLLKDKTQFSLFRELSLILIIFSQQKQIQWNHFNMGPLVF